MASSSIHTSTIVAVSAGTIITGFLAYAAYFDHKRRTDAEFRHSLKRESRQQAKAAKAEEEASAASQRRQIAAKVRELNSEGLPASQEQKETLFLETMQKSENLIDSGDNLEAAACLFQCLRLYPNKGDLIKLFDQSVPKDILDILALMVAEDPQMRDDDEVA